MTYLPESDWQTAAPEEGSGCFSAFLLPPFLVILLSGAFLYWIWNNAPAAPPAANLSAGISPIFRAEVQVWADSLQRWANSAKLDANLAATVMQIESCGDPLAKSSAGAIGLFQVMPYHFQMGEDPYNPETNALRGLAYLAKSMQAARGDARLALAGYNGGIGIIARVDSLWAAETQRYAHYAAPIYADAKSGAAFSPALNEWHQRYGVNLCKQARQRLRLPD